MTLGEIENALAFGKVPRILLRSTYPITTDACQHAHSRFLEKVNSYFLRAQFTFFASQQKQNAVRSVFVVD